MMRLINFLTGFVVGMALGGALVTLLAPQSGSETREGFRGRIEAILEEGRQAAESTRVEAHARLADLKAKQGD
jgi:gas vesicle protein